MSEPGERIVQVNGQPCRVWDKGKGRPVGYLAGFGGLPRWTPFLDRLAERYRVIAPALPGHPGGLGHEQLDSTLDWIAATLDLLEASGLVGADLIGASVGGALAAEVAALSPQTIRHLVLIAPFGLYDAATPPTNVWAQRPGALPALLCADAKTFTDFTAAPEGADANEWSIVMTRASEAAARLLWPLSDTRLERRLHRVRNQTLIVWGSADKVLAPAYAERFAAGIAGKTTVKLIRGAGHLADLDQPVRVAGAIFETLN
jgi:pimeloyl-ACP methyl ester carboxylesterase